MREFMFSYDKHTYLCKYFVKEYMSDYGYKAVISVYLIDHDFNFRKLRMLVDGDFVHAVDDITLKNVIETKLRKMLDRSTIHSKRIV